MFAKIVIESILLGVVGFLNGYLNGKKKTKSLEKATNNSLVIATIVFCMNFWFGNGLYSLISFIYFFTTYFGYISTISKAEFDEDVNKILKK